MPQQSSGTLRRVIRKQSHRYSSALERRMLKIMACNPHDAVSEFLGTARTGRRNAMPDILGQNSQTSCSDLPDRLQSLCTLAPESSSADRTPTTDTTAGPSSSSLSAGPSTGSQQPMPPPTS